MVGVDSGLTLTRDFDGTQIEHGETHEHLLETSAGTYTGSGTYTGGNQTATTLAGSRVTINDQDTAYTFDHSGWFDRTLITTSGNNTTTNRYQVDWDEDLDNTHDLLYTDTETWNADGTSQLVTDLDGNQAASIIIDYGRIRDSDTTGDYTRIYNESRGYNNLIGPATLLPIPELRVEIDSVIAKDLTSNYASDGSLTSMTGTDTNVGNVLYRHGNSVDGDYTYDRTITNDGPLNSGTQDQEDFWDEVFVDEYTGAFDHTTTFNANNTLTEDVVDTGTGDGVWHLHKDGDYRWDGSGNNWTTVIDDEYIHDYGDAWKYDLDADFTAVHDNTGAQLSKLGYYNITSPLLNSGNGAAGGAPTTLLPDYTGVGQGAVRDIWNHYLYDLDYLYTYSNSSSGGYSSYSSYSYYSSGSTSLYVDYTIDTDILDNFYHDDSYEILWDASGETRTEAVDGAGSGHKYYDYDYTYDFDSSYGGSFGSGSEDFYEWNYIDDDQDYAYSYNGTITNVQPIGGSFTKNGSVTDAGSSSGTRITDYGFTYSSYTDGSLNWAETGDFDETLTFTVSYNVTNGFTNNVPFETGTATVNTTFSWVTAWSDPYNSGSDSNSGSNSYSLMPGFDILRAGRERIITWITPLFEVGDEWRRVESWYAQAGVPVKTLIDPHPHDWFYMYGYGYGYGYGYTYGYGYGAGGGFNFN